MSISDRSSILGKGGIRNNQSLLNKSTVDSINASRRVSSVLTGDYRSKKNIIPTENLKFEQFCKIVFGSMMNKD